MSIQVRLDWPECQCIHCGETTPARGVHFERDTRTAFHKATLLDGPHGWQEIRVSNDQEPRSGKPPAPYRMRQFFVCPTCRERLTQ